MPDSAAMRHDPTHGPLLSAQQAEVAADCTRTDGHCFACGGDIDNPKRVFCEGCE